MAIVVAPLYLASLGGVDGLGFVEFAYTAGGWVLSASGGDANVLPH